MIKGHLMSAGDSCKLKAKGFCDLFAVSPEKIINFALYLLLIQLLPPSDKHSIIFLLKYYLARTTSRHYCTITKS
jgi:hypothetical protein